MHRFRRLAGIFGALSVAIAPVAVMATAAAPAAHASTGFYIESTNGSTNGWGTFSDGTTGDQVFLQNSGFTAYTRVNFESSGGVGYYEYKDGNGNCLFEDVNITHHPIVQATGCTTGTDRSREEFSDPDSQGNMQTLYDEANNGDVLYTYTSGISEPLEGTELVIGGWGWSLVGA